MEKLREFIHSLRLVLRPLVAAGAASAFWYHAVSPSDVSVSESDKLTFIDTLLPILGTSHAVFAAFVLSRVWAGYIKTKECIEREDVEEFKRLANDRIPMAIHVLLGFLALLMLSATMMIPYEGAAAGVVVTSFIAFVLVLYWEVATNLDNPYKAVWLVGRIPPHWYPGAEPCGDASANQ